MNKLNDLWAVLTRSELWVAAFVVISAIYEAGILPESWSKIAALIIAALTALGYGTARTVKKIKDAQTSAITAAATSINPTRAP